MFGGLKMTGKSEELSGRCSTNISPAAACVPQSTDPGNDPILLSCCILNRKLANPPNEMLVRTKNELNQAVTTKWFSLWSGKTRFPAELAGKLLNNWLYKLTANEVESQRAARIGLAEGPMALLYN